MLIKLDADNNISYNGFNWAYQVKGILDSLGLSHIWIHQFEMDIPFSLIKQRIFDMYKQTWYAIINNSNRLLLYARYKHDFNFENYLNFISENKYRVALTKLSGEYTKILKEVEEYVDIVMVILWKTNIISC